MRRRLHRLLACAALVALVGGVLPAHASATHELSISVASTSRVALSVAEGTYFHVEIDYPSAEDYAHFQVSGSATLGGYMLAPQGTNVADHYGIRLPVPLTYADEDVRGRSECGNGGGQCTLAPGDWWLYLIAEGGDATVTLRFGGAAPAVLSAPEPVATLFAEGVTEGFSATAAGNEAAHFTGTVSEPSHFLGLGYVVFDEPLVFAESTYATAHGFCVYDAAPDLFLPGCPDGDAITVWPAVEWDNNRAYLGSIVGATVQGTLSGSMYHITGGVQPSVLGSTGLWITK